MTSTLCYSTSTGDVRRTATPSGDLEPGAGIFDLLAEYEPEPHCFVCNRHTDHVGEHDALVEYGLARYSCDGSVHRIDSWDDVHAAAISCAEYAEYTDWLDSGAEADFQDWHAEHRLAYFGEVLTA